MAEPKAELNHHLLLTGQHAMNVLTFECDAASLWGRSCGELSAIVFARTDAVDLVTRDGIACLK